MAKPPEKTGSTAVRPIARNLIPVVDIYGFGWSAGVAVFNYWFDGLAVLAAIVAALIPRALRETQPKSADASWR
jgi:hypothetical protein